MGFPFVYLAAGSGSDGRLVCTTVLVLVHVYSALRAATGKSTYSCPHVPGRSRSG